MDAPDRPQIYLITPARFDPDPFADQLAALLDSAEIACIRLDMPGAGADDIGRAADRLRDVAHAREVALVVSDHVGLAERHGLDGVHLSDGARNLRAARKTLGPDAIVGAYCGQSRHDGLTAGEAGADYVSFGPLRADGLGQGDVAADDLFVWWSEMIELPVVAEGHLDAATITRLTPSTDFFGIGPEVWDADIPAPDALRHLIAAMG